MKKIIALSIMAVMMYSLYSQTLSPQVIASSGGYFEGTNASLSWTLGEPVTQTFASGNIILTQGFQQPITVSVTGINVDVLVYLEGPFAGTMMNTGLNNAGAIPLNQPYNLPPWNYSGTENVTAIPNPNIVDWVLVELRDAASAATATAATRIARQAAFLKKDGTIVGTNGTSVLQFNNSVSQQLFVVIWHRNHLGVLSANALTPSGGTYSFNFSTAITQAYGDALGYKLIGSGIYGMAGGDKDADGDVDLTDLASWKADAGKNGYKSSEFNLDYQVNNQDKNDVLIENLSLSSQVPN